jgi:flagellar L-ring protein precursor FlgH
MPLRPVVLTLLTLMAASCGRFDHVGRAPTLSPVAAGPEHAAVAAPIFAPLSSEEGPLSDASLWAGGRRSLLGDRRAQDRGDILTVVVELDEGAEIANSTDRSRSNSQSLAIPDLFGLPGRFGDDLPLDPGVGIEASGQSRGQGGVRRQERLTLRVAAAVVDVLPSGVLRIEGRQEVRVNYELREMLVTGYVRPEDVSRQNEITYDKIAAARISYGGRGQITDVQQPRLGTQVLDALLPF